jgi:hypothetical protein
LVLLAVIGGPAHGAPDTAPVLMSDAETRRLSSEAARYPLFRAELARTRAEVDTAVSAPLDVPLPKDPGGGFTHEQHKRNYKTIHSAGLLYRLTGEKRYAEYVGRMLLAYAELYPKLGRHPAARGDKSGRLFWQSLNDSVWLLYAIQGYDAVRGALPEADRARIDNDVFRRAAKFLSEDPGSEFDIIHNHATWSAAAVGMTGYVLREPALVKKALFGTDGSGKSGFLRQMDLLFSPDGYYTEGPYYQRYALMPFVVFARAIEAVEPQRKIFAHRDGILLKAIRTAIQLTYRGYFFPLNDALKDKGLWTEELYHGVAIAYERTGDDALLSIAALQNRTVLSPDGLAVARGLAKRHAKPFRFASICLRDGANGDQGALAVLRSGQDDTHQVLVAKNTAQGMGHGHFDKLSWLLYDNGEEVVTDYGGARFLNIEAKDGGKYLPENDSWAKQTIAHNTLVVDERSHFGGDWKLGQTLAPKQLFCQTQGETQIVAARMEGAYPDVSFTRTLAVLRHPDFEQPVVVDLLKASSKAPAQYDLPLHYRGQIMEVGFTAERKAAKRPVLGKDHGYQHLWADAFGRPNGAEAHLSWLLKDRFYTYRFIPLPGSTLILAESGANDPNFNLRREPVLIQRVAGVRQASFVSVLEPHGKYDGAAETTQGERSQITRLEHLAGEDADVILIATAANHRIALAVSHDPDPAKTHRVSEKERVYEWKGYYGRFDE